MLLETWRTGLQRYDDEDLKKFSDSMESLLSWNEFFDEYAVDMYLLMEVIKYERINRIKEINPAP